MESNRKLQICKSWNWGNLVYTMEFSSLSSPVKVVFVGVQWSLQLLTHFHLPDTTEARGGARCKARQGPRCSRALQHSCAWPTVCPQVGLPTGRAPAPSWMRQEALLLVSASNGVENGIDCSIFSQGLYSLSGSSNLNGFVGCFKSGSLGHWRQGVCVNATFLLSTTFRTIPFMEMILPSISLSLHLV